MHPYFPLFCPLVGTAQGKDLNLCTNQGFLSLCPASPELGGGWSSTGCSVITSHLELTTCSCNHTTNFAVLLQVYEVQVRNIVSASGGGGQVYSGQALSSLFFCAGAEERRRGINLEDPDFCRMWRLVLCPDCHLHSLPGCRVRLEGVKTGIRGQGSRSPYRCGAAKPKGLTTVTPTHISGWLTDKII